MAAKTGSRALIAQSEKGLPKGGPTGPGGKNLAANPVAEISFRPATNGLISETRYHSKDGDYKPPVVTVHPNANHAARHLKSVMCEDDDD